LAKLNFIVLGPMRFNVLVDPFLLGLANVRSVVVVSPRVACYIGVYASIDFIFIVVILILL
jgi:hypothetical protein